MHTEEIQIKYAEVWDRLAKLRLSIQALESTFPSNIGGQNELDVVNRLNELSQKMQAAMEFYKEVLMKNEEATKKSVDLMDQTDQQLAELIATEY